MRRRIGEYENEGGMEVKCPNCGRKMTLVWYEKGPPTENEVFGCKLADWNHPMLSLSYN